MEQGGEGAGEEGVGGVEEQTALGVDGPGGAEEAEVVWLGGGVVL